MESDVSEGDKVLLMRQKENKLSATYDPEEPCSVVSKRGDLVVIERGETLLKRNVGHVKRFTDPAPRASRQPENQHSNWSREQKWNQLTLTGPETSVIPAECPVSEPAAEPGLLPHPVAKMPEEAVKP